MIKFILLSLSLCNCAHANSPCTQMIKNLNTTQKKQLEMDISRQAHIEKANILKVFKDKDWLIMYADTYVSDETFFSIMKIHTIRKLSSQNGAVEQSLRRMVIYKIGLK
ncbi:hypothetical protein EYY94_16090 [Obesumbacterium proteus]|uniref:hypothetical protein n=1 Tax=Obesumbacterium proteus TaxID=82983 RepID=UPI0010354938|nr:hypothetical protein [Obesumbacterium proteus]TBL73083.1 hypothetical protein EYY94_16090 [Obesumbacterium proteus]